MAPVQSLLTERLRLRRWRPSDKQSFARINSDPVAMERLRDGHRLRRHVLYRLGRTGWESGRR